MSKVSRILSQIASHQIELLGELVDDPDHENSYYAFVSISRNKDGHQRPSNFKLSTLSNYLKRQGVLLNFILIEDENIDLHNNVKSVVLRHHIDMVRNCFVSSGNDGENVWIEPRKSLTEEERSIIEITVREFFSFMKIKLDSVRFTFEENLPTRTACLSTIRKFSPVDIDSLIFLLRKRDFDIPSREWLANTLDKIRKSDLIQRRKDERYILTMKGLRSLGSGKNRMSPDVSRALDIARRQN